MSRPDKIARQRNRELSYKAFAGCRVPHTVVVLRIERNPERNQGMARREMLIRLAWATVMRATGHEAQASRLAFEAEAIEEALRTHLPGALA